VLQEIAAARQLSILCGGVEITVTSFLRALSLLPSLKQVMEVKSVNSLLEMMSWQAPRQLRSPDHALPRDHRNTHHLNFLPLGELVERFCLHNASDQRDKVFALLGMCSMSNQTVPLPCVNYTKDWSSVMQDLVRHVLGLTTKTTLGSHAEQALVTGYGCPIGKVTKVEQHLITVVARHFSGPQGGGSKWRGTWRPEAHHNKVLEEDLLWIMKGACAPGVPVSTLSSNFPNSEHQNETIAWHVTRNAWSPGRRRISLIWDWLSASGRQSMCSVPHTHRWGEDSVHPSYELRLLDCARIYDDMSDLHRIKAVIAAVIQPMQEPLLQQHMDLLVLATVHWTSYMWLKWIISELRWSISMLKHNVWNEKGPSTRLLEYWKVDSCLSYCVLETYNFLATVLKYKPRPRSRQQNAAMYWDFGVSEHQTFLFALFHGQLRTQNLMDNTSSAQPCDWHGRDLIRSMLAHENLCKVSDYAAEEAISTLLSTQCPTWCVSSTLITLAVISEYHHHQMIISSDTLDALVTQCEFYGAKVLSFLLVESCGNILATYNILDAAIRAQCRYHPIPYRPLLPLMMAASVGQQMPHTVTPWLYDNILVLKICVEHTLLCEWAYSKDDDVVLPILMDIFPCRAKLDSRSCLSPCIDSRNKVLRGIEQFLEEVH
jgi:hypothetical protein